MKTLIFLITIIAATLLVRANENHEVIWETEQIGGINDVLVSPLGDVFYNVTGSTIQIRNVSDGTLIDYFIPNDMPNHITHISITDDGRYMAMSGDNPHIVIYDLLLEREVKRFTTNVFERVENGTHTKYKTKRWLSSSISPDGAKVTGVAEGDQATYSSCWVVIDLETGEELLKETRLGYDVFNPQKYSISEWISSEFTPDGNYIVSQIDWIAEDKQSPDSIYIYNANTLEVYDVILNRYNTTTSEIVFSNFEPLITTTNNSSLSLYNLKNRSTDTLYFGKTPMNVIFSRYTKSILVRIFVSLPTLYNYEKKMLFDEISYFGIPRAVTLDDMLIYWHPDGKLALVEINWEPITGIHDESKNKLELSPNPTQSYVSISTDCFEPSINYSIHNVDGVLMTKDVTVNQQNSFALDFSTYSAGVYFITFMCDNELKTYKIVKGS